MRKEFGKMLLDIAKYVATAVIVSDAFTKLQGNDLYVVSAITLAVLTFWGLFFVREPKSKSKNQKYRNNKKR